MYCHIILDVWGDFKCTGSQIDWCTGNWYFWFKYYLQTKVFSTYNLLCCVVGSVYVSWSSWQSWSECSVTCTATTGIRIRYRECPNNGTAQSNRKISLSHSNGSLKNNIRSSSNLRKFRSNNKRSLDNSWGFPDNGGIRNRQKSISRSKRFLTEDGRSHRNSEAALWNHSKSHQQKVDSLNGRKKRNIGSHGKATANHSKKQPTLVCYGTDSQVQQCHRPSKCIEHKGMCWFIYSFTYGWLMEMFIRP